METVNWEKLYDEKIRPKIFEVYNRCWEAETFGGFLNEIIVEMNKIVETPEYKCILGMTSYYNKQEQCVQFTKDMNLITPSWLSFISTTDNTDYPEDTFIFSICIVSPEFLEHIFSVVVVELHVDNVENKTELLTTLYDVLPNQVH